MTGSRQSKIAVQLNSGRLLVVCQGWRFLHCGLSPSTNTISGTDYFRCELLIQLTVIKRFGIASCRLGIVHECDVLAASEQADNSKLLRIDRISVASRSCLLLPTVAC